MWPLLVGVTLAIGPVLIAATATDAAGAGPRSLAADARPAGYLSWLAARRQQA